MIFFDDLTDEDKKEFEHNLQKLFLISLLKLCFDLYKEQEKYTSLNSSQLQEDKGGAV